MIKQATAAARPGAALGLAAAPLPGGGARGAGLSVDIISAYAYYSNEPLMYIIVIIVIVVVIVIIMITTTTSSMLILLFNYY